MKGISVHMYMEMKLKLKIPYSSLESLVQIPVGGLYPKPTSEYGNKKIKII